MQPRIHALAAALLCAGGLTAQFPLQGFMYNWDRPNLGDGLSLFVRWGATSELVLSRIDRNDYVEWGNGTVGQTTTQGFMTWINDANDVTRESFDLVGFDEDPNSPDFPNTATPLLNIVGVQMPPTGTTPGNVAWRLDATLTQPVTFAGTGDVFVGLRLPAMVSAVTPFDGLFVGSVNNDPTMAPFPFDIPGPAAVSIGQGSYICYVPTGQPARYLPPSTTSLEQLAFDVHVPTAAGGAAIALTTQAGFPSSMNPGTSNFLSGMHPDIARGDNIGFGVTAHTAQVLAGSPAFVVLGFGPSTFGTVPITAIPGVDPASSGSLCIETGGAFTFFTLLTAGQPGSLANMLEGQFVFPLSAGDRALVGAQPSGFDIWWQAFVLDGGATGLELHATGCATQHLK